MSSTVAQLKQLIDRLQAERSSHVNAIEEIDGAFSALGIVPSKQKRRGRPPKGTQPAKAKKGKRRKYAETAAEFVSGLLGKKGMTSAEVNAAWKKSGRPGSANNTLTVMTKAGTLKREKGEGARGGVYGKA